MIHINPIWYTPQNPYHLADNWYAETAYLRTLKKMYNETEDNKIGALLAREYRKIQLHKQIFRALHWSNQTSTKWQASPLDDDLRAVIVVHKDKDNWFVSSINNTCEDPHTMLGVAGYTEAARLAAKFKGYWASINVYAKIIYAI